MSVATAALKGATHALAGEMLGDDVTSKDGFAPARNAPKDESAFHLDEQYERLFLLLAELRCASVSQLHALFFAQVFRHEGQAISLRSTYNRIATLQKYGYLRSHDIPGTPHSVLFLSEKARSAFPLTRAAIPHTARKTPTDDIASYGFMRAALWSALLKEGFSVGRDLKALTALRRNLVDRQRARVAVAKETSVAAAERTLDELRRAELLSPRTYLACTACKRRTSLAPRTASAKTGPCPACGAKLESRIAERLFQCSHCDALDDSPRAHRVTDGQKASASPCPGAMRHLSYLPFDLAWRKEGSSYEVLLLVVDDQNRSVQKQLEALPLRFLGQPRLKVILRPCDDDSTYDLERNTWATVGTRYRQLQRAFSAHEDPRGFPYWETAEVVTYKPELQLRIIRKKKHHAS
jgi:hypothetical protein